MRFRWSYLGRYRVPLRPVQYWYQCLARNPRGKKHGDWLEMSAMSTRGEEHSTCVTDLPHSNEKTQHRRGVWAVSGRPQSQSKSGLLSSVINISGELWVRKMRSKATHQKVHRNVKRNQGIRTKDSRGDTYTQSWRQVPGLTEVRPYQALDDLQQFLHDHSDALVTQESADGLKMRGPHKVPVGAVDVAVGNVERLENRGCSKVSSWELNRCGMSAGGRCFADTNLTSSTLSHGEPCEWVCKILAMERDMINNHRMEYRSLDGEELPGQRGERTSGQISFLQGLPPRMTDCLHANQDFYKLSHGVRVRQITSFL